MTSASLAFPAEAPLKVVCRCCRAASARDRAGACACHCCAHRRRRDLQRVPGMAIRWSPAKPVDSCGAGVLLTFVPEACFPLHTQVLVRLAGEATGGAATARLTWALGRGLGQHLLQLQLWALQVAATSLTPDLTT